MTIPFVCVMLAGLIIYVPRIFIMIAQKRMPEGFDNNNPRDQHARLTGLGKRAVSAHLNSFEGFPLFAAAVFVAHLAGADPKTAAALSIAYVTIRAAYVTLYLANLASARSLVWMLGMGANIALFLSPYAR